MSPLKRSNNIAARMGRWSASHWKTAVFGWLVFVAAAFMLGMNVGTKNIKEEDYNTGQSHKADQILKQGFPETNPQTELVLVQSSTLSVNAAAFRSTIDDVVAAVRGNPAIKQLKSPLSPGNADQISSDRSTVLVTFDMKGKYDDAKTKIDPIESAVAKVAAAHPASTSARPVRSARARRSTRCSATN